MHNFVLMLFHYWQSVQLSGNPGDNYEFIGVRHTILRSTIPHLSFAHQKHIKTMRKRIEIMKSHENMKQ